MSSVLSVFIAILLIYAILSLLVSIFNDEKASLLSLFMHLKFSICKFSLCVTFSNVPPILATSDAIPLFIPKLAGHRCFSSTLCIRTSISIFLSIFPFTIIGALLTYPTASVIFITLFEKSIFELILLISIPFAFIEAFEILRKPADLSLFKSPFIVKSAFSWPLIESMALYLEKSASNLIF